MAEMKKSTRTYKLTGLSPILGMQAASKNLREQWLASKAPDPALGEEELANNSIDLQDKGLFVFSRYQLPNREEAICMMNYHIKGFFKEAFSALKTQTGLTMYKQKADLMIFVEGRYGRFIPITRDGKLIYEEDDFNERSIRVDTMSGQRSAINCSEQIYEPWELEIVISLIENAARGKSDALTWEKIELALDYGGYHGLGHWRNAGFGTFTYKLLDEE